MKVAFLATHPIQNQAPLYRALAKIENFDFTVIFASNWGVEAKYDEEFQTRFAWDVDLLSGYPSRTAKPIKFLNKKAKDPRRCWSHVWTELKDFDFVVIRGYTSTPDIQAISYCLLHKKAFAFFPEGYEGKKKKRNQIVRFTRSLLLRFLYKQCRLYFSIGTHSTHHFLQHCSEDRKIVKTCYVVDNKFFAEGKRPPPNQSSIPEAKVRFIFAGKLSKRKGVDLLVKAFMAMFSSSDDVSLTIVGDGELRTFLDNQIVGRKAQIHLLGFKNQQEMRVLYKNHHCLILPSIGGETWGLVVNEAIASGIPAIVSNSIGCAVDLITEGTGLIFESGKISELQTALRTGFQKIAEGAWPNTASLKEMSKKTSPELSAQTISSEIDRLQLTG